MSILLIVVVLLLLFGGGGYGYSRYGYGGLGGVLGLVIIVLLIIWATGGAFAQTPAAFNAAMAAKTKAASNSANPIQSILSLGQQVQQFTLSDLQAAAQDASNQTPPDTRHGPCWMALATVVQNQNLSGVLPNGLGAAQLIQKTFDLQSTFEGHQAWKDQIATACALTVADLATDLNTLLAKAGLSAVNTAIVLPKL